MRSEYLKELELLPLWQLRKPLAHVFEVPETEPQVVDSVDVASQEATMSDESALPNVVVYTREDGHLQLMHLADGLSQAEQQLLQNIAKSMQLKREASAILDVALQQPAVVVLVLGEVLAQSVLSTQKPLQDLRGQAHSLEAKQVVVTDELQTMLGKPETKVQVWKDCCLAMSLLVEQPS